MEKKGKITQIVFQAIDDVNQLLIDKKIEKSIDTDLIGESSKLDSLGLLNLIVAVEDRINDNFGSAIILTNENSISDNNPFKNIQALVDYIETLLK